AVPEKQRLEFLAWLAGPAGLLTDRSDGTLVFTHLSFQEYLARWPRNATVEGEERSVTCGRRLKESAWWESLRLWAALLESKNPARLEGVLVDLSKQEDLGLPLVGCIL